MKSEKSGWKKQFAGGGKKRDETLVFLPHLNLIIKGVSSPVLDLPYLHLDYCCPDS